MTARTRRLAPFATVLAAGLLAACGGTEGSASDGPASSTTSSSSSAAESGDTEPSDAGSSPGESTTSGVSDGPAQQELTAQQIRDALPTEDEAPHGYVDDPRLNIQSESTLETRPATCRALYLDSDEARKWKKEHISEVDGVRYSEPSDAAGRPGVVVSIATYDRPVPAKFFDAAGSTLGECRNFAERNDDESEWIDKRAVTVNAPAIGDQTYAHRVGLVEIDLVIDQLSVRSGHNIVTVRHLTDNSTRSEETMTDLAEGVLEDLEG